MISGMWYRTMKNTLRKSWCSQQIQTTFLFISNLIARLDFTQTHLELLFEGDRETKPVIRYYFLPYIKISPPATPREKKPREAPGHFIDYHDNYHIDEIRHKVGVRRRHVALKFQHEVLDFTHLKSASPRAVWSVLRPCRCASKAVRRPL
jgi:hypothetical protein